MMEKMGTSCLEGVPIFPGLQNADWEKGETKMRIRFWFSRPRRFARVEFRDGHPARVLRGIRRMAHEGSFITLRTAHEIYHWHEAEVRFVQIYTGENRPLVKKEASF